MKLFQSVQRFWQIMGINSPHPNQIHLFNAKSLFFILSLIMVCISTVAFLVLRAEAMLEYGICVYGSLSDLTLLADILITIWQIPNIFQMIEMCEQFIELSKYCHVGQLHLQKQDLDSNAPKFDDRIEK